MSLLHAVFNLLQVSGYIHQLQPLSFSLLPACPPGPGAVGRRPRCPGRDDRHLGGAEVWPGRATRPGRLSARGALMGLVFRLRSIS